MAIQTVNTEAVQFTPTTLLSLFTLDSRYISVNGSIYRFCSSVNGLYQPVIFDGVSYTPFPIELTQYEIPGQGSLPRPRLKGSNINGFLSQYLRVQGDLVGARLTIKRVYARFIDAANFAGGINPFGTPDTTAAYEDILFFVNRKVTENTDYVEMELSSPFELDGAKLPARQLNATICGFRYRDGETCGYIGAPVSDRFGKLFTTAAPDGYGLTLNSRGPWIAGDTYVEGDWVTVVSQNDFSFGETFAYVCVITGTTGTANNPQFNQTNWIADMCPHNLLGCDAHFDAPLPFGASPGISRASYVDS